MAKTPKVDILYWRRYRKDLLWHIREHFTPGNLCGENEIFNPAEYESRTGHEHHLEDLPEGELCPRCGKLSGRFGVIVELILRGKL